MTEPWARRPADPIMKMLLPAVYGSTPTLFGAPGPAVWSGRGPLA